MTSLVPLPSTVDPLVVVESFLVTAPMASIPAVSLLLIALLTSQTSAKSCQSKDRHPYQLFASKTAYDEIRSYSVKPINVPGCTPKQFYLLARHGTRYPKTEDIQRMRQRLPALKNTLVATALAGKGKLCLNDVDKLNSWQFNLTDDQDQKLNPVGENEMQGMGMRFKLRLPSLFDKRVSEDVVNVLVTNTERAQSSAKHFLLGLLGERGKSIPLIEDTPLLRFYKTCDKWKTDVNKNESAIIESILFKEGPKMDEMVEDVSKRVGLKNQLSRDDIQLMYDTCRYEVAWDQDVVSPWCYAFKDDDLRTLEYSEDIKYYYKHGYGHEINYKQACPIVNDLVRRFRAKMNDNSTGTPDVVLRFSHSGMMLKVLSRLGFFQDSIPLTASNYKAQKERMWRTSRIDSFATNLAFVLLDCKTEFKVATYFQEKGIALPSCIDNICSANTFLNAYSKIADNCNLQNICHV